MFVMNLIHLIFDGFERIMLSKCHMVKKTPLSALQVTLHPISILVAEISSCLASLSLFSLDISSFIDFQSS